jgi:prepilin-type N-terminal cleavage/methylation domain-containing protein
MPSAGSMANNASGYTLVELVAVICIGSILAFFTLDRLVDPAGFDEVVVKDGLLVLSRSTQQASLGQDSVQLTFTPSGSNVVVSSVVSGAVGTSRTVLANEVAITAGAVGDGTSCGSISSTITLNFDSAGEIETVDDDGFPICLNGQSSLCISPAGFAHLGACL